MPISLRTVARNELRTFLETCEAAFGWDIRDDEFEQIERVTEPERSLAAFDGEAMVGTAGAFTFTMSVPGGDVAAAGVTQVGVLPTHRRRGILRAMMAEQLTDVHSRGEPVAILWASEAAIYQRYGYGLASFLLEFVVDRNRARWLSPPAGIGHTRLLTHDEAVKALPPVYEDFRATTPGMPSRSETWWEAHRLRDIEHSRDGASPLYRVLLEIDGRPAGYALYRTRSDWSERVPGGTLEVVEAIARPEATKELWRFLFGVDLIARIKARGEPVDSPLLLQMQEPNYLRATLHDGLWLRIVDVEKALTARTYAGSGSLVVEVQDDLCDWNAGSWRLHVGEVVSVTRTTEPPDLRMGIAELGSAYLGGFSFTRLEQAGRIQEARAGSLAVADAMFTSARAPFCPEIF